MEKYIKTPTLEDYKKGVNHAHKLGITSITNQKLKDDYWNEHKEETLLYVDDETIFYGRSHEGVETISIDEFLKYEKRKD